VAFRELARLDIRIMTRLQEMLSHGEFEKRAPTLMLIQPKQFFGLDVDEFGVELAKVTLMVAKKLALDEAADTLKVTQEQMALGGSDALPLDNMDANIRRDDALFTPWPEADTIIGNPPFQSKNKMIKELSRAYVNRLRTAYKEVPGRADYCVYWFRKAHDHLKPGQRAGLVGTNTVRQNYSRIGGLDYVVRNGGTITEAVSSQVWSGDAVVHVSIVNWKRGPEPGKKKLFRQVGDQKDSPWEVKELDTINSALSFGIDLKDAHALDANAKSDTCFQGQTHGHEGFLIPADEARAIIAKDKRAADVLFPFLITDDLIGTRTGRPSRYVIDFGQRNIHQAQTNKTLFQQIESRVLKAREASAERERAQNEEATRDNASGKVAKDHATALEHWWLLFRARGKMLKAIGSLPRYIACGRVTRRPIFAFIHPEIHPNDSLAVFPIADDYSFGILQSGIHWQWFIQRCSTMKGDWRYTSNTVFDSFPWPQKPSHIAIKAVAAAAVFLRKCRADLLDKHDLTLRELYRTLDKPGASPMKTAQANLDEAVRQAYGMKKSDDPIAFLLDLNQSLKEDELGGVQIASPGLPPSVNDPSAFITADCVRA
jgi:hypothetical protein